MDSSEKTKRPAPWLDLDLADREGEEWRDVTNYDGYYQVSSHGRVKSLARLDRRGHRVHARIKKQKIQEDAAMAVHLCVDRAQQNCQVLRLVGLEFLPALKEGQVWYHKNKLQTLDNCIGNIIVGTVSDSHNLNSQFGLLEHTAHNGKAKQVEKELYDKEFGVFDGGVLVAKVCASCMMEKPIARFSYGQRFNCKRICHECSDKHNGVKEVGKAKHADELAAAGLRICTICKQTKSLDADFYNARHGYLGKSNACKPCSNQRCVASARAKRLAKKNAQ